MSLSDEDKQWVGERLDQVKDQVAARIGQVEARLLAELRQSPSPAEMRRRTHAAVLRAIDLELEGPQAQ